MMEVVVVVVVEEEEEVEGLQDVEGSHLWVLFQCLLFSNSC